MHEAMPRERGAVPSGGRFLFRAGLGRIRGASPGLLGSGLAWSSGTAIRRRATRASIAFCTSGGRFAHRCHFRIGLGADHAIEIERPGIRGRLRSLGIGCAIVASDTQPLHEAIKHDQTGRLVNFFDVSKLTNEVCALLDDPKSRARLGKNAREFALTNYDLKTVCLPRQLQWVQGLGE